MQFSSSKSVQRVASGGQSTGRQSLTRVNHEPSQAALKMACSELLTGEYESRHTARAFLRRHSGRLESLPVDVLRGIVSEEQAAHVVLRVLRELRYHPRAVERSAPVLVHVMRHGEAHIAAHAGALLGSVRSVRDAAAVPVLVLGSSQVARHERAARAFELKLRGEEVFDLEVYRPSFTGFRARPVESQAESVYAERKRDWFFDEAGRSVVFGALAGGSTHPRRVALDALLALNYSTLNDQVRACIEASLAFISRDLLSHEAPRLILDLFIKVASSLEYSPELASVFLESGRVATLAAKRGEISPEMPVKFYYGAAVLLRDEFSQEAIQGLGAFLETHDPKILAVIAKRCVALSAELPESSGEQIVGMLFKAVRDRILVEAPEAERRVLLQALREVSGYDNYVVDSCAKLLAEVEGEAVQKIITEILHSRISRMLEDAALQKATAMLRYLERKSPAAQGSWG